MPYQPVINGTRYMVSAGHFLATQAGFDILEAGGWRYSNIVPVDLR